MSQLNKLSLLGIRSFGPDASDQQTIKFQSPLTLILGQNGCGKTTIIEALKFACSGELPPGSKQGQGFVFDPKLIQRSESKGMVKLQITGSNGDTIVVAKAIQLTQRLNKTEFKRTDTTLSRRRFGQDEYNSISGRCVDVDVEMSLALGVSRAILNNVIFCHQDDSNWPLEEGRKLKERFDAIFDAKKYNNCVEYMRKLRKNQQISNKLLYERLKLFQMKSEEVEKMKHRLTDSEKKMERTLLVINDCEEKIKPLDARMVELQAKESEWAKKTNSVSMKKARLDELKKDIKSLSANLKIFEGSDAELELTIAEFEKQLLLKERQLSDLEKQLREKHQEEQAFLKSFNQEQINLAQLKYEETSNTTRITKRDRLLNPLCESLEIPVEKVENAAKALEVFEKINGKLKEKQEDHEQLLKDIEYEDQQLQTNIDRCRESKISMEQTIKSKMQQLKEVKAEVRRKKREVDEANASSSHLEIIHDRLERNKKELDSLVASVNIDELSQQMAEHTKKRDEAEQKLEVLDKEVKSLQLLSNTQTELDLQRENVIRTENEIKKLRNKHEEALNQLFDNAIPEGSLKSSVDKIKKEVNAKIRELNNSIKKATKKVTELEIDVKYGKEKLASLQGELEANEKKITEKCGEKPLPEVLNESKAKLEKLQLDKGNFSNSKFMYTRFIQELKQDDPCCPLCKRDFHEKEPTFVKQIVEDIAEQIEDFPNRLKNIEVELTSKQAEHNKLVQLESIQKKIELLRETEIPGASQVLKTAEEDLAKAKEELEVLHAQLMVPQDTQEQISSIGSDVGVLDKYVAELKKLKPKVAELEEQVSKANPSSRTLQEALSEQEALKSEMSNSRRQAEALQKRLNGFNDQKQYLQETNNKLVQQQLQIEKNVQGIVQIQERFSELQANESKLSTEVATLEGELLPLKKELDAAIDKKILVKKENKKKVDKSLLDIARLQKEFQEIKNIQTTIEEFYQKKIDEKIFEMTEKIAKLEVDKKEMANEKANIQTEVDQIKNFLAAQKTTERSYKDNQRLREKTKEEEGIKEEIAKITEEMKSENISGVTKEKRRVSESLNSVMIEKSKAEGRRTELNFTVEDLKQQLAKDENVKAEQNFFDITLEYKVRETALADLLKIITAIDYALMTFHRDKMVQINQTIRELWRQIYRGNDIDYVEIKTDLTTTSRDGRRAFNYRVVQVKNGVELEMRGRCSAGQRVLASLIIRIALADTFSSNCGILALDEPTTNLDKQNIHSLCEALAEIIHHKRHQKHFQLIVITHDRDFLESLSAVEKLEQFYEVSRNREGKSVIREVHM